MNGLTLPAFRKLAAREQLGLLRAYPRLMPRLLAWGLDTGEAQAVAYNATLLSRVAAVEPPLTPAGVLERYSLDEIAALCETYRRVAAGELEYGGREEAGE